MLYLIFQNIYHAHVVQGIPFKILLEKIDSIEKIESEHNKSEITKGRRKSN